MFKHGFQVGDLVEDVEEAKFNASLFRVARVSAQRVDVDQLSPDTTGTIGVGVYYLRSEIKQLVPARAAARSLYAHHLPPR